MHPIWSRAVMYVRARAASEGTKYGRSWCRPNPNDVTKRLRAKAEERQALERKRCYSRWLARTHEPGECCLAFNRKDCVQPAHRAWRAAAAVVAEAVGGTAEAVAEAGAEAVAEAAAEAVVETAAEAVAEAVAEAAAEAAAEAVAEAVAEAAIFRLACMHAQTHVHV
eukprot:350457-Chlamydomonas_euryale.AAC.3